MKVRKPSIMFADSVQNKVQRMNSNLYDNDRDKEKSYVSLVSIGKRRDSINSHMV